MFSIVKYFKELDEEGFVRKTYKKDVEKISNGSFDRLTEIDVLKLLENDKTELFKYISAKIRQNNNHLKPNFNWEVAKLYMIEVNKVIDVMFKESMARNQEKRR